MRPLCAPTLRRPLPDGAGHSVAWTGVACASVPLAFHALAQLAASLNDGLVRVGARRERDAFAQTPVG